MDLVEPLDPTKISNWEVLPEQGKNNPDVFRDNKYYGMPFTWDPDALLYNADVIKTAPTSWNAFSDPQYKGKVSLWDDISNIYRMAMVLGYDKPNKEAIYNLTDAQLETIKQKLIAMKPQIKKYWATSGELNELIKSGEVNLAVGWPQTPAVLNSQNKMNIKSIIPIEGADGWFDRLMIVKGAKNKELAQLWLDYVSSPEAMAKVAEFNAYNVCNPNAEKFLTEENKYLA